MAPLQLEDLAALDAPAEASGAPLLLELELIDEDPEQPRQAFDEESLQALAETIRQRGVRQPVSVRPHPTQPGRWVLNFGARRLRACRLAGLEQIPAFVDQSADSYDQVIENEQREGLRPLELALFVQKRLGLGEKQAEIARRLGKSKQWVTLVTAMIEPPDWLLQAYRDGRCNGLNELYELRRLHGQHGDRVLDWMGGQSAITRDRLLALKAELDGSDVALPTAAVSPAGTSLASPEGADQAGASQPTPWSTPAAPARRSPSPRAASGSPAAPPVFVRFEGQTHQLLVELVPEQAASMYVAPLGGGPRKLVAVAALTLLGFAAE